MPKINTKLSAEQFANIIRKYGQTTGHGYDLYAIKFMYQRYLAGQLTLISEKALIACADDVVRYHAINRIVRGHAAEIEQTSINASAAARKKSECAE